MKNQTKPSKTFQKKTEEGLKPVSLFDIDVLSWNLISQESERAIFEAELLFTRTKFGDEFIQAESIDEIDNLVVKDGVTYEHGLNELRQGFNQENKKGKIEEVNDADLTENKVVKKKVKYVAEKILEDRNNVEDGEFDFNKHKFQFKSRFGSLSVTWSFSLQQEVTAAGNNDDLAAYSSGKLMVCADDTAGGNGRISFYEVDSDYSSPDSSINLGEPDIRTELLKGSPYQPLAVLGTSDDVRVVDVENESIVKTFTAFGFPDGLDISETRFIVGETDLNEVRIYDTTNYNLQKSQTSVEANRVAINDTDFAYRVNNSNGNPYDFEVRAISDKSLKHTITPSSGSGVGNMFYSIDHKYLAVGAGGSTHVYNAKNNYNKVGSVGSSGNINWMRGNYLFVLTGGTAEVYDVPGLSLQGSVSAQYSGGSDIGVRQTNKRDEIAIVSLEDQGGKVPNFVYGTEAFNTGASDFNPTTAGSILKTDGSGVIQTDSSGVVQTQA